MIENTLGSKRMYKLFIGIIKYVPNVLAITKIVGLILNYFGVTSFFLTCFGGTSFIMLLLLYLISIIFRFCGLYRLSLHYVTLITLTSIFDWYFKIPISTESLYQLYGAITGVFATAWIWVFYKNRKNPKVDHIKQLCDKYICR